MNIIEAMESPEYFGNSFRQRGSNDSWAAWKIFLRATFALPMSAKEREFFRKCTGRESVPHQQVREVFAACGRRSGKTRIAALIGAYVAALVDHSEYVAPGESVLVPLISTTKEQATILLGYVKALFHDSPSLRSMVTEETAGGLKLSNGVEIAVLSGDYKSIRGRACPAAIVDELAFIAGGEGTAPDKDLLDALRPSQMQFPHPILCGISSPYARRGELYRMHELFFGKESADVLIWRASSLRMNGTLSRAAIITAFIRDPQAARSEYLAEFRNDLAGFVSAELLDGAIVRGRTSLARVAGVQYYAFADPSGGRHDSFCVAIAHREADGRGVLDVLLEREAPFSPAQVIAEFSAVLKYYGVFEVEGDKYAAEFCAEQFQACGIQYRTSSLSRSDIYLNMLPLLTSQRVELLDNARMRTQFLGLERRTGTLRDVIDHVRGAFDDVCNTAAGALVLACGNAMEYGVLSLWKKHPRWEGFMDQPTAQEPQSEKARETESQRYVKRMREMFNRRGIPEPPKDRAEWREVKCDPCEKCGSVCVVQIAQAQHCNSCRHDVYKQPMVVVVAGRNGVFSKQL